MRRTGQGEGETLEAVPPQPVSILDWQPATAPSRFLTQKRPFQPVMEGAFFSHFALGRRLLSDQGSNLDFLESKSSVLPVTPSDSVPGGWCAVQGCKGTKRMIRGKRANNFF